MQPEILALSDQLTRESVRTALLRGKSCLRSIALQQRCRQPLVRRGELPLGALEPNHVAPRGRELTHESRQLFVRGGKPCLRIGQRLLKVSYLLLEELHLIFVLASFAFALFLGRLAEVLQRLTRVRVLGLEGVSERRLGLQLQTDIGGLLLRCRSGLQLGHVSRGEILATRLARSQLITQLIVRGVERLDLCMGAGSRVTSLSKLRGMPLLQLGDTLIRFRLQLLGKPRSEVLDNVAQSRRARGASALLLLDLLQIALDRALRTGIPQLDSEIARAAERNSVDLIAIGPDTRSNASKRT